MYSTPLSGLRTLAFCTAIAFVFGTIANAQRADFDELVDLIQTVKMQEAVPPIAVQDPFGGPARPVPQEKQDDKKKKDDKKKEDEDVVVKRTEIKPANPREVRFHLWDGNIFTGDLSGDGVTVVTEFGDLKIPVEKLYGFRPGLDSFPELYGQLKGLVEKLGDKDFNEREKAHKDIVNLGPQFLMQIYEFEDGGNAERKRHLKEIREELEEMSEDMDAMDEEAGDRSVAMIRGDSVQTKDFTVVGKIKQDSFVVKTKHGDLNVKLADIKYMDRSMTGGGEARKTVRIMGTNMAGKNMKSTGIRVEKGDTISVRASGSIVMTPWGSNRSTGPEGNTRYSKYQNFNGGSLLVQVGDGKFVYVGAKKTIKAPSSGTLKLGVAIPQEYMSYAYPGEFRVNLRVVSGGGK